jgi:hypothetical protein
METCFIASSVVLIWTLDRESFACRSAELGYLQESYNKGIQKVLAASNLESGFASYTTPAQPPPVRSVRVQVLTRLPRQHQNRVANKAFYAQFELGLGDWR